MNRNMSLVPADFLVCVVAAFMCPRRLDGLAIDNASRGNNLTLLAHSIKHQSQVVDRPKQEASY